MRKMMMAAVAMATVSLLMVAGCTQQGAVSPPTNGTTLTAPPVVETTATQVFTAIIDPVNNSAVHGEATVTVSGLNLMVEITASGLTPGQEHAQHIHGLLGSQGSTCPPAPSVPGSVTLEPSAEQYYGPVIVPLVPFQTASASGEITYSVNVSTPATGTSVPVLPLAGHAVVLHGMMVNGVYDPGVPVGCGEFVQATGP